ncbi:MAG: type IX secretion system membrane protein PorP/SprF [Muribaculaceae bacterium]|nr:type IX secretion system membrane protein PorP/SprF [Muribaculaceae bacterium]
MRRILTILLVLSAVLTAAAQNDLNITQYYAAPTLFNPGATGNTDELRIRGGARLQWLGVDHAPQAFLGAADMPFKIGSKRIGAGVVIRQQSEGLYHNFSLGAQGSYKFRKFGGIWSVGIQVGFYDQSFKGSEVYLPDGDDYHQGTDDAIPTQDIHGTAVDFGAGIWYEHPKFYAGLSATHLTSPKVTMNSESASGGSETSGERRFEFQADRILYFTAGSNIPIKNTLFEIMPSVLVKTSFTFTTAELMARVRYRKFLSAGIGYRWDDAIVATIAAEVKNFFIGYSYDYSTGVIGRVGAGTHELFAGYSLKLNLGDKNRHRHKSVRIM